MIRKSMNRLAIAGGSQAATTRKRVAGLAFSEGGLFGRMMRALHLHWLPLPRTDAAAPQACVAEPPAVLERCFANEREALAYADCLTAQGIRAEVLHDPYDYSWSVEVHGSLGDLPRCDT